MQEVFITGSGSFLPGAPVANREMESRIGLLGEHSRRLKALALRQNGIRARHYAIDADGNYLFSNAQMAARAVEAACDSARRDPAQLQYLACGTTQADLLVPGIASSVHGELGGTPLGGTPLGGTPLGGTPLGGTPLEISSHQSVCGSSMMAIKSAWLNIRAGQHRIAAASGSEFSSRWFQPGFYRGLDFSGMDIAQAMQYEFLRWTLSDGAGALVLEDRPDPDRPGLRIDWIEQKSFADRFPNCMYAGAAGNSPEESRPWSHYDSPGAAYGQGAIILRQDFDLLEQMFPVWMGYFLEVLDKHQLSPADIRYFLPHYSARSLGERMKSLLTRSAAMIPEERWHNHQSDSGNVGAATIFLLIDRLLRQEKLRRGDRILCFVPESGRCLASFMGMTVV